MMDHRIPESKSALLICRFWKLLVCFTSGQKNGCTQIGREHICVPTQTESISEVITNQFQEKNEAHFTVKLTTTLK